MVVIVEKAAQWSDLLPQLLYADGLPDPDQTHLHLPAFYKVVFSTYRPFLPPLLHSSPPCLCAPRELDMPFLLLLSVPQFGKTSAQFPQYGKLSLYYMNFKPLSTIIFLYYGIIFFTIPIIGNILKQTNRIPPGKEVIKMTIEEQVKSLILERYGSIKAFSTAHDIPNSTVDNMFRRGFRQSSVHNVIKLCQALHISTDGVADGVIISTQLPPDIPFIPDSSLTPEQKALLDLFDQASPALQRAALAVLESK